MRSRGSRHDEGLLVISCRRGELVPETVVPLVLFRWRRSRCICAVPRGHRAAGPTARHNLVHIQIRVPSLAARNVRRPIGVLNYVFDTPIRNAFARRGIFGRYKTQTGCEIVQIFLLLGLLILACTAATSLLAHPLEVARAWRVAGPPPSDRRSRTQSAYPSPGTSRLCMHPGR